MTSIEVLLQIGESWSRSRQATRPGDVSKKADSAS